MSTTPLRVWGRPPNAESLGLDLKNITEQLPQCLDLQWDLIVSFSQNTRKKKFKRLMSDNFGIFSCVIELVSCVDITLSTSIKGDTIMVNVWVICRIIMH